MSHVSACERAPGNPLITDLACVPIIAKLLGAQVLDQREWRWYGHHVGDWPVPEGIDVNSLGKDAVLVLRFPNTEYDLAIIKDPNNPGCFTYIYDWYGRGGGLTKYLGEPIMGEGRSVKQLSPKFEMYTGMALDKLAAERAGDYIEFEEQKDGSWVSYAVPDEQRLLESL